MDDEQFFQSLLTELQTDQFIQGLVGMRKLYENFLEIINDEISSEEEKNEARELTKDGFYPFVGKLIDVSGRK